jgi:hypothetical protein
MSETRNLCSGLRRFLDVAQRVLGLVLLALEILRRLPLAEAPPITRFALSKISDPGAPNGHRNGRNVVYFDLTGITPWHVLRNARKPSSSQ